MGIRYFIVDNETDSIKAIQLQAVKIAGMITLGYDNRPRKALEKFKTGEIVADVTFIDIQMQEMQGLELAKELIRFTSVVVVSADQSYALEAYQYGIEDYIKKPVTYNRLKQCIERLRETVELKKLARYGYDFPKLVVKADGKTLFLNQEEIVCCESQGNYVKITVLHGKCHMVLTTLSDLFSTMLPWIFMKTHRSFIVNLKRVTAIEGNIVEVYGGHKAVVSDALRAVLMKRLHA